MMIRFLCLHLLLYFYLLQFSCTNGQPQFISRVCQDTFGNYTSNSTFATNLKTLVSALPRPSNTSLDSGFYNVSVGKDFDIVNGIGLCRPDISLDDCHTCIQAASSWIVEECPNQKDAIGWYELCMVRYSDRYIFHKLEFGPWYHENVTLGAQFDIDKFNQTAATLLAKLQLEASSGDSLGRKFGAGSANMTKSGTIYALVQCTPDLSYGDCYNCLDNAIGIALTELYGQVLRLFFTSCNIRFETNPFYTTNSKWLKPSSFMFSPPPVSTPDPPPAALPSKGKGSKKSKVLIIVLPLVITSLLLLTFFCCYAIRKKTTARKKSQREEAIRNQESLQLDFDTIRDATKNFSDSNKLGQGGFGAVFKGKLEDGQEIAVKRLSQNSSQGEEEFRNEAILIAKLRHRNLVRFLGYSSQHEEKLLIYELLPNKSLDYFLFDPVKRSLLNWETRYKIIGGIARGLLYLHEESRLLVVHRDLKAGNILLDAEMNPKITDFGMARLFGVDQTRGDTSKICGTFGYMPPEYVQQGQFSFKSDVYSFGVLVLEIICGLQITNFYNAETGESLLSYVWRNWLEDTAINVVDPSMSEVNRSEVLRCINIGLLCVQENITHRPIMSSIILMLNSDTISPALPSRPAFLLHNAESQVIKAYESRNEVTLSEFYPR